MSIIGEIYWSDTSTDVIGKAHPVDFEMTNVVSDGLDMADGIAIDSIGRKVIMIILFYKCLYNYNICYLSNMKIIS